MSPEQTESWGEYKQLFLADRTQNKEDHERIFKELKLISDTLIEMKAEKHQARRWASPVVAAIVAAIVAGASKALGF